MDDKELEGLDAETVHEVKVLSLTDPIFESIERRLLRRIGILTHMVSRKKASDFMFYPLQFEAAGICKALRIVEEEFIEALESKKTNDNDA